MKNNKSIFYLLFLIVIVGFILRLLSTNDYLVYPDSYIYMANFASDVVCNKPMYCLLSWLFGGSEISLRIISFVSSVAIIPLSYLAAKKYFGIWSGIFSAIMIMLSIHEVAWSSQVIPDVLASMFLLLFIIKNQNPYSILLIIVASLIRPEYLVVLLLFGLMRSGRERYISFASFVFLAIYFVFSNEIYLTLTNYYRYPTAFLTLLKFEPVVVFLAVAPIFIKINKKYLFLASVFLIFCLTYYWQNPGNWRYSLNLIAPLVIMASYGFKLILGKVRRGSAISSVIVGIVILMLLYQVSILSNYISDNRVDIHDSSPELIDSNI